MNQVEVIVCTLCANVNRDQGTEKQQAPSNLWENFEKLLTHFSNLGLIQLHI